MSAWRRHLRARRARGDRGVVLIEAAIAFPVFFLLVLGIIEYGFYMAASSTTTSAARDGARLASAEMGPASSKAFMADKIRDATISDMRALNKKDAPVRLWVYKAYADGSPCSDASCTSGTAFASCPDAVCFRYTGWDNATQTFTTRSGGFAATDACLPGLNVIGVHLQVVHGYVSRILGSSATLNERTVLRLEPLPLAQCP